MTASYRVRAALMLTAAQRRLLDSGEVEPEGMLWAKLDEAGFAGDREGIARFEDRSGTVQVALDDDGELIVTETRDGWSFRSQLDLTPDNVGRVLAFILAAVES
jgi:hypothetical protein